MMRQRPGISTKAGALALALLLAGCGPLISFGNDGPADAVYSLRYEGNYAPEISEGPLLYFDEPLMAEGLAGHKIAVRLAGYKRSTLSEARWATGLSTLVRDYLVRALGNEAQARTVSEGGLDVKVDCRLGIKIWSFDYVPDAGGSGQDVVDVAIELSMVRLRDGQLLSQRTFIETPPVGQGGDELIAAFNGAMNSISADMALWLTSVKDRCPSAADS